jgi:NADPH:quinone reductase-like Zn-dependent oxidoreductase
VSASSPIDQAAAAAANIRAANILVRPSSESLAKIGALVEAGKLKVEIAATFPLSEATAALELSKTGHTRGKIVMTVGE